jgi:PUA domain protein
LKKWVLSRRDSLEMIGSIETTLGISLTLPRSAQASCEEPEDGVVFVHFGEIDFIKAGGGFIPFLGSPGALSLFPTAVVDEGAIRYLLNGADVMRPGVKILPDWGDAGRTVVVKEEKKGRAIAVGVSLVKGEDAVKMSKGPCLRNVHHVGDRYWNLFKMV